MLHFNATAAAIAFCFSEDGAAIADEFHQSLFAEPESASGSSPADDAKDGDIYSQARAMRDAVLALKGK